MTSQTCTGCQTEKPGDQFWANRITGRRRTRCKTCMNDYHRAYLARTGSKIQPRREYGREYHLRKQYGLSANGYAAKLAEQGGGCAVCGTTEPGGQGTFHVDHDHSCCPGRATCGKCVRGLLCLSCNFALGAVQDSVERLEEMIRYLAPSQSQRPNMTPVPSVTGGTNV